MNLWQHGASYAPQLGPVWRWLIAILYHRTIDYLRSVRRRSILKEATWEEVEQDERTAFPDVWDEAWQSVISSHVRTALMKIPIEQRLVIELAYFQGRTHAEIAEGMQIPLGTVKARIRLGLTHLKRVLIQMGMDET